jgi:hypothetical protein
MLNLATHLDWVQNSSTGNTVDAAQSDASDMGA